MRGGPTTTDLSAPAHAGRIFHGHHKLYWAIGESDHPYRKALSVGD